MNAGIRQKWRGNWKNITKLARKKNIKKLADSKGMKEKQRVKRLKEALERKEAFQKFKMHRTMEKKCRENRNYKTGR